MISNLQSHLSLIVKLLILCFVISTVLVFEILVGAHHLLADSICLLGAAVVTISFAFYLRKRSRVQRRAFLLQSWKLSNRLAVCLAFIFLLLAWSVISLADLWSPSAINLRPQTVSQTPNAQISSQPGVAVALSGGGYRAALFHAGVLSELERLHVQIQAISSVSGGSIIGSFYAVGGRPEEFLTAVSEHRFNLKREFLNITNIWRFSRTEMQANLLDRLFLNAIKHKDTVALGRPELMLCTTDVAASDLVGITPNGIVKQQLAPAAARSAFVNPAGTGLGASPPPSFDESTHAGLPGELRVSELVAASGAFPGALNPLHLEKEYVISSTRTDTKTYVLADGGVGDNLGLVLAYDANHLAQFAAKARASNGGGGAEISARGWNLNKWQVNLIIASDGSAISLKAIPHSFLGEIGGSIDSMYNATGGDQMRGTLDPTLPVPPAILLSPRTIIDATVLKAETWNTAEHVTYLPFGTELVLQRQADGQPTSITFTTIDPETLDFIINNMIEADRDRAHALISQLKQGGVLDATGVWHQPDWQQGSHGKALYDLVMGEFDRRVRAFITASTLDDQFDREKAESIYLLGQYITRLNQSYIIRYIKTST